MSTARYALALVLALTLVAPPGQPRTTAVVDRFEGDRAVLVTDDGRQVVVGLSRLPASGRYADAVLRVTLAHGTLTCVEYDREAPDDGRGPPEPGSTASPPRGTRPIRADASPEPRRRHRPTAPCPTRSRGCAC